MFGLMAAGFIVADCELFGWAPNSVHAATGAVELRYWVWLVYCGPAHDHGVALAPRFTTPKGAHHQLKPRNLAPGFAAS